MIVSVLFYERGKQMKNCWYGLSLLTFSVVTVYNTPSDADASNCHLQTFAPVIVHRPAIVQPAYVAPAQAVYGTYYSNIVVGYTPEIPPAVQEKLLKQREEILNLRERQLGLEAQLQSLKFGGGAIAPGGGTEPGTIPAPLTKDSHPGLVVLHNACFKCHNDKISKDGINLFPKGVLTTDGKLIEKSVNAVHERRMPPASEAKLTGDQRYDFLSLFAIRPATVSEPGTIPAP